MPDDRGAARHRGGGGAREREECARVRRERPVPVLVVGLERRADDAGRGGVHEHVERPERSDLLGDAGARRRSRARGSARRRARVAPRRSPRPACRLACSRSRPGGAERGEPERDRLPDPSRPARDEDGAPSNEVIRAFGSGSYAGADEGTVSQPMRDSGSRSPSLASDDACPSRSRSSIFSSPYFRTGWSSGRSSISSRTRARS